MPPFNPSPTPESPEFQIKKDSPEIKQINLEVFDKLKEITEGRIDIADYLTGDLAIDPSAQAEHDRMEQKAKANPQLGSNRAYVEEINSVWEDGYFAAARSKAQPIVELLTEDVSNLVQKSDVPSGPVEGLEDRQKEIERSVDELLKAAIVYDGQPYYQPGMASELMVSLLKKYVTIGVDNLPPFHRKMALKILDTPRTYTKKGLHGKNEIITNDLGHRLEGYSGAKEELETFKQNLLTK